MAKYPAVRLLFLHALGDPVPDKIGVDLAEALDVSEATASRWINGDGRPKGYRWPALAKFLNVNETEVRQACSAKDATAVLSTIETSASLPPVSARVVKPPGDNAVEKLRSQVKRLAAVVKKLSDDVEELRSVIGALGRPANR